MLKQHDSDMGKLPTKHLDKNSTYSLHYCKPPRLLFDIIALSEVHTVNSRVFVKSQTLPLLLDYSKYLLSM